MNEQQLLASRDGIAALLAAGVSLCKVQQNPHSNGRYFVLVPNGPKVEVVYLERPDNPTRKSGTIKAHDVESFIETTSRYRSETGTVIYASLNPLQFTAVLNENSAFHGKADWRDHRVVFLLQHSKEWLTWDKQNGKKFDGQEEFAYFIEGNMPDFKAPPGARMLDVALNFRAKQSISYKGATRLQNGTVELNYQELTEGAGGAQGKIAIPELFTISIPVWAGLDQKKYELDARLRYRVSGGQLSIWYELDRPHKVIEQAFQDTLDQVEKSLAKTPVIFGTPE